MLQIGFGEQCRYPNPRVLTKVIFLSNNTHRIFFDWKPFLPYKSNNMKKNVGAFDGLIRMLIGVSIIFYAGLVGPWWLGFIALVPILNAAMFYCPIYDIAGISTCHEADEAK